tara:strand:+ start:96 stop:455 length:360 start_codon:yes stop_codon:yes gene_type:complete
MKKTINLLIFTLFTLYCTAQQGKIKIEQDSRIEKLLDLYKSASESSEVYQIQIFNGTLNGANSKKVSFDIDFPNWNSKIFHVDTDYRVRIGGIKTALEAERKYIEIRKKYPAAIIIPPN